MKNLLFPIALLLCAATFAQTPTLKSTSKLDLHHKQLLGQLLHQQLNQAVLKTTTAKERVIGESLYLWASDSLSLLDSMMFKYNDSIGSTFDYYSLDYASPISQFDNNSRIVDIDNPFGISQNVFSDTSITWRSDSGSLNMVQKIFNSYSIDNTPLDCYVYYIEPSIGNNNTHYHNTLSASGNINADYTFTMPLSSTTFDSTYRRYFTYNTIGQLIQDSIYQYVSGEWIYNTRFTYKYDINNNLISLLIYSLGRYREEDDMTYYGDGKLRTIITSEIDSSSKPRMKIKDSIGYVIGSIYPEYLACYSNPYYDTSSTLGLAYTQISHINAHGFPDTITLYYPSGRVFPVDTLEYDTLNNPTAVHGGYGQVKHFYYETYTATQIPTISQNTDNIKIYPNPATNQIYINIADATPVYVNLINANGQLIRTESIPANNQTWQMSIDDLILGTYFISICDRAGNKLHSQAIIKQ